MDLDRAQQAIERAFAPDIEEGTAEVRRDGQAVVLDGGNWTMGIGGALASGLRVAPDVWSTRMGERLSVALVSFAGLGVRSRRDGWNWRCANHGCH